MDERTFLNICLVKKNSKMNAIWKVKTLHFADGSRYWMGASDIGQTPGQFLWGDGSPVDNSLWSFGEPIHNDEGVKTCVVFDSHGDKLLNNPCSEKRYFMCEVPERIC